MKRSIRTSLAAAALALAAILPVQGNLNHAAAVGSEPDTYSSKEIISEGHNFFGNTTKGLAQAVERDLEARVAERGVEQEPQLAVVVARPALLEVHGPERRHPTGQRPGDASDRGRGDDQRRRW